MKPSLTWAATGTLRGPAHHERVQNGTVRRAHAKGPECTRATLPVSMPLFRQCVGCGFNREAHGHMDTPAGRGLPKRARRWAQGAVAIFAPGRVAVKYQRADAVKNPVRSLFSCEPAATMHRRGERYVARAHRCQEIWSESERLEPKIHWRVDSRGVKDAPHVRATKGSDRTRRSEGRRQRHAQRVALPSSKL